MQNVWFDLKQKQLRIFDEEKLKANALAHKSAIAMAKLHELGYELPLIERILQI